MWFLQQQAWRFRSNERTPREAHAKVDATAYALSEI
jgi:hypothetical protein